MEERIKIPDEVKKAVEREEEKNDLGRFYRLKRCSPNDYKRIMNGADYLLLVKKMGKEAAFTRVYSIKSKNAITIRVSGTPYWVITQKVRVLPLSVVYRTKLKAEQGENLSEKVLRGQWKWEQKKKREKSRRESNYVNIHPGGTDKKNPEEPSYIQKGAAHPYSGGGFSPK